MAFRYFVTFFLAAILAQVTTLSTAQARQHDFTVFDVRKNLPLHEGDPVYRDFYINMGSESGAKVGDVVAVYRRVPVIDVYRNRAQGDLNVPIAHLKIIQTERTMSVCRLASLASEKQIPVVQFEAVMMGDRVEFADSDDGPAAANANNGSGGGSSAEDSVSGTAPRSPAMSAAPATAQADPEKPLHEPKKAEAKAKPRKKSARPDSKAVKIPAQA